MDNNKALGMEFFKTFWSLFGDQIMRLYGRWEKDGKMNSSARQGIISLLPKGNKDPKYLKIWRPFTLLNLDFKILVKAVAMHLKLVLQYIIGSQQTGFLRSKQITENIVNTMDVIAYTNMTKKLLIVTIDFEKCFVRITYTIIFGSLKYFGVDDNFIDWTQIFFNQFQVMTQNAGVYSTPLLRKDQLIKSVK